HMAPSAFANAGTRYRTARIDGVDVFYRDAGPVDAPVVVLLHGFPTSSNKFSYTFAKYAAIVDALLNDLGAKRYALYVMDYGAPVGYRLALMHPERVTALIVQNGNAYDEGLREFWDPIKAYWTTGSAKDREALRGLTKLDATKWQYTNGVSV